jgi:hypothetical protein
MHKNLNLEIAIPIYKKGFDKEEQLLVDRMFKVFVGRHISFFGPANLDNSYYLNRYPNAKLITFDPEYFLSVQGYSRLLLNKKFYESFGDKEFLLISQPDAYVFRDELDTWLNKPYDYVGAPWPNGFSVTLNMGRFKNVAGGTLVNAFVGNGGFSLRRINKCVQLLEQDIEVAEWFSKTGSNEDLFFSFIGQMTPSFIIPNPVEASHFAMEVQPEFFYNLNGYYIPMAAHALKKFSPEFWEQKIQKQNAINYPY